VTQLAGQVAVVTGASRGIGLAVAESLAAAGATVIRIARTLPDVSPVRFVDLRCDLADPPQIAGTATRILREHGAPAIVVQNAGLWVLAPFEETRPEDLDRLYALNLRAPFLLAQRLLPAMRAARSGMHIIIGSILDHQAFPDNSAYTATKYGVRGLHESLREEYRGSGVRFALVSPASTDTPMWDPVNPDQRPGFLPRREMLRAEDVAEAVHFVATRPPHATVEWLRLAPNPVETLD
jgi:NAD(P)-dependent dehydrogenase (short-subunit alcohol dehydrogenase family)